MGDLRLPPDAEAEAAYIANLKPLRRPVRAVELPCHKADGTPAGCLTVAVTSSPCRGCTTDGTRLELAADQPDRHGFTEENRDD